MATVTYYDSTSDGDADYYKSPWIAVYDTDCVDSSYLDAAYQYTVDCMDYAYSENFLSGYTVKKRSINDWCPDCCGEDIVNQWNAMRDSLNITHEGEHALIHSCTQDCHAPGTRDGNNPWSTDCGAVATTDTGIKGEGNLAETVMHEVLHGHCRSDLCDNVASMISKSEHDLGVIKEVDGKHSETPLAGENSADRGQCDTKSGSREAFTHELSLCEMDGMEESADHTAGFHDCSGCK